MADRPIIFSALMVRALLAGRKTQTRRLATSPHPDAGDSDAAMARLNAARDQGKEARKW